MTTQVVLLGTGTPDLSSERYGASTAIVVDDTAYIVDLGPGAVYRMVGAKDNGIKALAPAKVETVFITHLHSDHTVALNDLLLSAWVLGRENTLHLYGPTGLHSMVDHLLKAYEIDIHQRIHGVEALEASGIQTDVHKIQPGVIYEDERVNVEAFSVKHGGFEAYGFKFTTADGKTVVISGDTVPLPVVAEKAADCDLLIHNAYSAKAVKERSEQSQQNHRALLTSTVELAQIANQAKPKRLVLTHIPSWDIPPQQLVDEVKEHYDGEVIAGRDLDVFRL
jgi:ribonuclease BN (tRNA processing enzyme)